MTSKREGVSSLSLSRDSLLHYYNKCLNCKKKNVKQGCQWTGLRFRSMGLAFKLQVGPLGGNGSKLAEA